MPPSGQRLRPDQRLRFRRPLTKASRWTLPNELRCRELQQTAETYGRNEQKRKDEAIDATQHVQEHPSCAIHQPIGRRIARGQKANWDRDDACERCSERRHRKSFGSALEQCFGLEKSRRPALAAHDKRRGSPCTSRRRSTSAKWKQNQYVAMTARAMRWRAVPARIARASVPQDRA